MGGGLLVRETSLRQNTKITNLGPTYPAVWEKSADLGNHSGLDATGTVRVVYSLSNNFMVGGGIEIAKPLSGSSSNPTIPKDQTL